MRGRGGQTKATTVAVDGCILGIIDIEESLSILVSSSQTEFILGRYNASQSPTFLNPSVPGTILPRQKNYPGGGGVSILTLGGERVIFYSSAQGKVFEVTYPPKNTPPDQVVERTLINPLFAPVSAMASWVWKYEIDADPSSATYQRPVPILYLLCADFHVYRWDGVNLRRDTPTALTNAAVLCVWRNDLVAFGTGVATKRNYASSTSAAPWDVTYALPIAFEPKCAMEFAGTWFAGGIDSGAPTTPGVLLYLNLGSGTVLSRYPVASGNIADAVGAIAVHRETLLYSFSRFDGPSQPAHIGSVTTSLVFDDGWSLGISGECLNDENKARVGAMLSTQTQLFVTVSHDEFANWELCLLDGASTAWATAYETAELPPAATYPPMDMAAF